MSDCETRKRFLLSALAVIAVFAFGFMLFSAGDSHADSSGDVTDGSSVIGTWMFVSATNELTATAASPSDAANVVMDGLSEEDRGAVASVVLISFHRNLSGSFADGYPSLNGNICYRGDIISDAGKGSWTYSLDDRTLTITRTASGSYNNLPNYASKDSPTLWTPYFFKTDAQTVKILNNSGMTYSNGGAYMLNGFTSVNRIHSDCITKFNTNMGGGLGTVKTLEMLLATEYDNSFSGWNVIETAVFPKMTIIPGSMFYGNTSLKSFTFATENVKVGARAFYNCVNLETLVNANGITRVDYGSFYNTALTTVVMNSLTSTGDGSGWEGAFQQCDKLITVSIPNILTLRQETFNNCDNLTTVALGSSLTSMGISTFKDCPKLESVTSESSTLGSISAIGNSTFEGCVALGDIALPTSLTAIGQKAFYNCVSLENIVIPSTVGSLTIDVSAFENCTGADTLSFGNNVGSIANNAFKKCGASNSVTLPGALTAIGNEAFRESGITGLVFASGSRLETIGDSAFQGCMSLDGTIEFGSSLTSIGKNAFRACSALDGIAFPEDVALSIVNEYSFYECTSLKGSVELGTKVMSIGSNSFRSTSITSLVVAGFSNVGTPTICVSAFEGVTTLTSVSLGEGLYKIESYAFKSDTGINTDIDFPDSLQIIDQQAFHGCTSMTGAIFSPTSNLNTLGVNAFYNTSKLACQLRVPENLTSIPNNCFQYSGVTSIVFSSDSELNNIGQYAFSECKSLSCDLNFPAKLETIGQYAFFYCSKITGVSFPVESMLRSIGGEAFRQFNTTDAAYTSMMDGAISFPSSLESIGSNAFYMCNSLEGITFSEGSLENGIGSSCFAYCSSIDGSITFPASMGSANPLEYAMIPNSAFRDCGALKGIAFASGSLIHTIFDNAFYNCSSLFDVVIFPASLTTIANSSFRNCTMLKGIEFEEGSHLTSIGSNSFRNTRGMIEPIAFPASLEVIYQESFYESTLTGMSFDPGSRLNKICQYAFYNCDSITTEIVFPASLKTIEYRCFEDCDYTKIISFEDCEDCELGERAFYSCDRLEAANVVGVSVVGGSAFNGCTNLVSEINLKNATTVGVDAFRGCHLKTLNIGPRLTTIGAGAFNNWLYNYPSWLESITVDENNNDFSSQDGVLYNKTKTVLRLLPARLATAPNLPSTLTAIDAYAACGAQFTGKLTLPRTVTSIGDYAFYNCSNMTELELMFTGADIFDGVKEPFGSCVKIAKMTLPISVKYYNSTSGRAIGNTVATQFVFVGTTSNLDPSYYNSVYNKMPWHHSCNNGNQINVRFDEGVVNIDSYMFRDCRVKSIEMADTVRTIGTNAFVPNNSTHLKTVTLSAALESIGADCFKNNTSITTLVAPIGCSMAWGVSVNTITSLRFIGGISESSRAGFDYSASSGDPNYYQKTPWYGSATKYTLSFDDNIKSLGDNMYLRPSSNVVFGANMTLIGDNAFNGAKSLSNVSLANITYMGDGAFADCTGITSIAIPDGYGTSVDTHPFTGCSNLKNVTMPINIDYATYNIFHGCILNDFTFSGGSSGHGFNYSIGAVQDTPWYLAIGPGNVNSIYVKFTDSVRSIGSNMFNGMSLDKSSVKYGIDGTVSFPHITSIGENAFNGCFTIDAVVFSDDLVAISNGAFSGCTSLQTLVIPTSVSMIGAGAFSGCTFINTLTIPLTANSVASADMPAFTGCTGIRTVNFTGAGNGYDYLDEDGIRNYRSTPWYISRDSIQTLNINDGILGIGSYTFKGCTTLSGVISLPSSVEVIGASAFMDCVNITGIVGDGVIDMGSGAFSGCVDLSTASFGALTEIPNGAFLGCTDLTRASIASCTYIGPDAFRDSGIRDINGDDPASDPTLNLLNVVVVGESAFEGSDAVSLIIGNAGISTIVSANAFRDCRNLSNVQFDSNAVSICTGSFRGCTSIAVLIIPATVGFTGQGAFAGCTGIRALTVPITTPVVVDIDEPVFSGCVGIETVNFTAGIHGKGIDYTESGLTDVKLTPWYISNGRLESVTFASGIVSIGKGMFRDCTSMGGAIALPATVASIGEHAFAGCTLLYSFDGPNVTDMGASAFEGDSSLVSVAFDALASVPDRSFHGCTALSSAALTACTAIGESAFEDSGITEINAVGSVNLPNASSVGASAFAGSAVTSIALGKGAAELTIGANALSGCSSLTTVSINGIVNVLVSSLMKYGAADSDSTASLVTFSAPRVKTFEADLSGSPSLRSVDISGATVISGAVLKGCTSLETVVLYSNAVKTRLLVLPGSIFEGCTSLSSINLDTVSLENGREFFGCASLTDVSVDYSAGIPAESFRNCTGMTSFSAISATSIGSYALSSTGLVELDADDLPKAVLFSDSSFRGCTSLEAIEVSNTLRFIGESAFMGCTKLAEGFDAEGHRDHVVDLKMVSSVGANAFVGTVIETFRFGSQFQTLGSNGLKNPELVSVDVSESNPYFTTQGGILYNKAVTELFFCPAKVAGFTDIALPATLKKIGASAFEDVELKGVLTLPSLVESVGDMAFANCTGLTSLVVNCPGATAGTSAFADTSFAGCDKIATLTVPMTMMLGGLFSFDNGISTINFTGNNSNLDADYYEINHSDMPWAHSIRSITVNFIGSTTSIDPYMFCFDSPSVRIVSISLCPTVQTVGASAFKNCRGLEILTLPDKLGSVGAGALDGCSGIRALTLPITLDDLFDTGNVGITGLMDLTFTAGSNGTGVDYTVEESNMTLWHASSGYNVIFTEGVKSIGDNMCLKPSGSSPLVFPNSMRTIGEKAFHVSDVAQVTFNNGLETIESGAFAECQKITSIVIPDTVTRLSMENGAPFLNCTKITDVRLPITINYATSNAFLGCDLLTRFVFTEGTTSAQASMNVGVGAVYSGPDSGAEDSVSNTPWFKILSRNKDVTVQFHKDAELSSSIRSIGAHMFDGCAASPSPNVVWGLSGTVIIPASVRTIGDHAFNDCAKMSGVTLSNGVQGIGEYAFAGCSEITDLSIPGSVTAIGKAAFSDCSKIATLTLPISLNTVVDDAEPLFMGSSSIVGIDFTGGLTEFHYADATGYGSFYQNTPWYLCGGNSISISFDGTVAGLGDNMFRDCTAIDSSMSLPSTILRIGDRTFEGCTRMTSFTGNGVTSIGANSFKGCTSMVSFTGDSVAASGANAFEGCTGMTVASLPALSSVSDCMFSGCASLTDATLTSCTSIGAHAFEGSAIRNINHVGDDYTVDLPGLTHIGEYAFAGSGVVTVNIGTTGVGITSFGDCAFADCANLVTINIDGIVSNLPANTFRTAEYNAVLSKLKTLNAKGVKRFAADMSGFTALKTVDLSTATAFGTDGVATSGHFKGCNSLTEVRMLADSSKPAVSLTPSMFEGCVMLSDIDLDNADLSAERIFFGCTSLTSVDAGMATSVGSRAFEGTGLTSITASSFPVAVSFADYAFASCASLASLEATDRLETIGDNAFLGCSSLAAIAGSEMPSVRTIGANAFKGTVLAGDLSLPEVVTIGEMAFYETAVSSFTLGRNLGSIGDLALFDQNLSSIRVDPANVHYRTDSDAYLYRMGVDGETPIRETLVLIPAKAPLVDATISEETKYVLHYAAYRAEFAGRLTIPASVQSVAEYAFADCSSMAEIVINAVKADVLDSRSFHGCTSVTRLTVPITVMLGDVFAYANSIGDYVFIGGLSSHLPADYYRSNHARMPWAFGSNVRVTFVDGVGEVDPYMFYYGSPSTIIRSVSLGNAVSKIGESAFYNCSMLETIVIPDSVSSIGADCLYGCGNIRSMTVPISTNMAIDEGHRIGIANLETLVFTRGTGEGWSYDEVTSTYTPWHGNSSYSVVFDPGIVSIGDYMRLKPSVNFILPAALETIGSHAFEGSSITAVDLKNVKTICDSAFEGCTGLQTVTIPDSVASLEGSPFRGCVGISSVTMPVTLDYSVNPFDGCRITSFAFTAGTASASGEGFDYTVESVKTTPWYLTCDSGNDIVIAFSGAIRSIGDHMFHGCSKQTGAQHKGVSGSVVLPGSIISIGEGSFHGCNRIASVEFGSGLRSIGDDAFNGCSGLTGIALPRTLESLGAGTFRNCSNVASLTVPITVNTVVDSESPAFRGCGKITSVSFIGTGAGVDYASVDGDSYYGCTPWHYSKGNNLTVSFQDTITGIGDYTFFECTGLKGAIVLPASIRNVGECAFSGCSGFEELAIENLSAILEPGAFRGCSGIESLTISIGINAAGSSDRPVFGACTSLRSISFIGNAGYDYRMDAGEGCYKGTPWYYSRTNSIGVTFANSITLIGDNTFRDCIGMNGSIECGSALTRIGDNAFLGCTGITGFTAPGVMNMGRNAFDGCTSLETVEMVKLQRVSEYAFRGCMELVSATLTACTYVEKHAFENSGIREVNSASAVSMPRITGMGEYAFAGSGIVNASFGSAGLQFAVGEYALFECISLKSLSILGRVGTLPANTFKDASTDPSFASALTTLAAPSVTTFLADLSENFPSLTTVDISGTTSFGSGTLRTGLFKNCISLATVRLFADANSATQVRLPPSMFEGCRSLSSIDLQNIRLEFEREFYGCTSLTTVAMPVTVTVTSEAFRGCTSLTEFSAASATKIDDHAFAESGLEGILETDLPNVTILGNGAYRNCVSLVSVNLPKLENVGEDAFMGCGQLYDISVDSLGEIGVGMFSGCISLASVSAKKATKVRVLAFFNCRALGTITLEKAVEVGDVRGAASFDGYEDASVFYNCISLSKVSMPEVRTIGALAFYRCSALTAFNDENEVMIANATDIGYGAFAESGVSVVTVGKTGGALATIGEQAFYACSYLTSFASPSLRTLPARLFNTTDAEQPSLVPLLSTVNVPKVEAFNADLHGSTSLTTVNATSAKSFAPGAFMGCTQLATVRLMDLPSEGNVVKLSPRLFSGCTKLSTIDLTNVQLEGSLEDESNGQTFYNCSSLTEVDLPVTTQVPAGAFLGCIRVGVVTAPAATAIGVKAFQDCMALSTASIEKVTIVEDMAFSNCGSLYVLNPDTGLNPFIRITKIGAQAFSNCAFTELVLGPMLTELGEGAFSGCGSLSSVVTPNMLININENTFRGCPLESIHLSSGLISVSRQAFDYTGAMGVSEIDIWFNGTLQSTTLTGMSFVLPANATVTIHVNKDSLSAATYHLEKGSFFGNDGITVREEINGNVNLQFEDGSAPAYRTMGAIYGGRVVLPYYASGSTVRDYWYSTTSNGNRLAVFDSEESYLKGSNGVARSGSAVPVYPLQNDDALTFSGATDTLRFMLTYDLTTEDYEEPAYPEIQTVHYGGVIVVPKFNNPLAKTTGILLCRNNGIEYSLQPETASVFAGYYFTQIVVMSEDTMVTVVFQSNDVSRSVEVMLLSNFVLPAELSFMEIPKAGFEFAGWWSNPDQGGEMATSETKFLSGQVWYARFTPVNFTLVLESDDPYYYETFEMTGPYTLHVVDGSLYYTDSAHKANTLMFKGSSIPGYNIRLYMDRNANKQVTERYGEITDDRTIDLSLAMLRYEVSLRFTLDGVDVSSEQVFTIANWAIGKGTQYHNGDSISNIPYEYRVDEDGTTHTLSDGLLMPVPLNQDYAMARMYAGGTELVFNNGYTLHLSHFDGSNTIEITYALTQGLYKIAFAIDDDTGKVAETGDSYREADFFTMATVRGLAKTGYNFVGFEIEGMTEIWDAMEMVELTSEMISHAENCVITIKGVWDKVKYDIGFDLGEYEGELEPIANVEIGATIEFPTVTGYTGHNVSGWRWKAGDVESIPYTTSLVLTKEMIDSYSTPDRKLTLKSDWSLKTYRVTVDTSSGVKFIDDEVTFGEQFKLWDIGSYTRKYMVFNGWQVGPEGTRVYGNNTASVLNIEMAAYGDEHGDVITFFMSWKDNEYMVQYNLDGGDGTTPIDDKVYMVGKTSFTMAGNKTAEGEDLFYKNGYEFIGWRYSLSSAIVYNNTSGLFDPVLAQNTDANGIVTLYAVWSQKSYKIAYSLDGGRTGSYAPTSALYGDEVTISAPVKAGYEFTGWKATGLTSGALCSSSAGFRSWDGDRTVLSNRFMDLCDQQGETVTMVATWVAASYIVSWDLNGASQGIIIDGSTSIELGVEINLPELRNAVKTGYYSAGWSVDKVNPIADGTVFRSDMVLDEGGNTVVFYVVWKPIEYTLEYRYSDADEPEVNRATYVNEVIIPIKNRVGREFVGWSISNADLSTAYYSMDGQTWYKMGSGLVNATYFKNLTSVNGATVSMTGQWKDLQYSIVYDANGGTGKVPVDTNKYTLGSPVTLADYNVLAGTNGNKAIVGWSLSTDNSVVSFTEINEGLISRADVTRTIVLHAAWIEGMVTVTVDLEGATVSAIPSGWAEVEEGKYSKTVNYGTSTKEIMADWENVTVTKDGYTFDRWEYGSGSVMSNISVTPTFEEVDMKILYGFGGTIAAALAGVLIFVRLRR